jgi:hypothetical protein
MLLEMLRDKTSFLVRSTLDITPLLIRTWNDRLLTLKTEAGGLLLFTIFLQSFTLSLTANLVVGGWLVGASKFFRLFTLYNSIISYVILHVAVQGGVR